MNSRITSNALAQAQFDTFCDRHNNGSESVFTNGVSVRGDAISSFTILLAEDEVIVRNLLQKILAKNGYDVMAGANGREALLLAKAYDGHIHLLLTDIQMPEMNGFELVEIIKEERPETEILMMSGRYSDDLGQLTSETAFIRKPFRPKLLLERVEQLLARKPERGCS
jgi:CheY-like chemotaxis protein